MNQVGNNIDRTDLLSPAGNRVGAFTETPSLQPDPHTHAPLTTDISFLSPEARAQLKIAPLMLLEEIAEFRNRVQHFGILATELLEARMLVAGSRDLALRMELKGRYRNYQPHIQTAIFARRTRLTQRKEEMLDTVRAVLERTRALREKIENRELLNMLTAETARTLTLVPVMPVDKRDRERAEEVVNGLNSTLEYVLERLGSAAAHFQQAGKIILQEESGKAGDGKALENALDESGKAESKSGQARRHLKDTIRTLTKEPLHSYSRQGMLARGIAEWVHAKKAELQKAGADSAGAGAGEAISKIIDDMLKKNFSGEEDPEALLLRRRTAIAIRQAAEGTLSWPATPEERLAQTGSIEDYLLSWSGRRLTTLAVRSLITGVPELIFGALYMVPRQIITLISSAVRISLGLRNLRKGVKPGETLPAWLEEAYLQQQLKLAGVRQFTALLPNLVRHIAAAAGAVQGISQGRSRAVFKDPFTDIVEYLATSGAFRLAQLPGSAATPNQEQSELIREIVREKLRRVQALIVQMAASPVQETETSGLSLSDAYSPEFAQLKQAEPFADMNQNHATGQPGETNKLVRRKRAIQAEQNNQYSTSSTEEVPVSQPENNSFPGSGGLENNRTRPYTELTEKDLSSLSALTAVMQKDNIVKPKNLTGPSVSLWLNRHWKGTGWEKSPDETGYLDVVDVVEVWRVELTPPFLTLINRDGERLELQMDESSGEITLRDQNMAKTFFLDYLLEDEQLSYGLKETIRNQLGRWIKDKKTNFRTFQVTAALYISNLYARNGGVEGAQRLFPIISKLRDAGINIEMLLDTVFSQLHTAAAENSSAEDAVLAVATYLLNESQPANYYQPLLTLYPTGVQSEDRSGSPDIARQAGNHVDYATLQAMQRNQNAVIHELDMVENLAEAFNREVDDGLRKADNSDNSAATDSKQVQDFIDNRIIAAQVIDGYKVISLKEQEKWLVRYDEVRKRRGETAWKLLQTEAVIHALRSGNIHLKDVVEKPAIVLLHDYFIYSEKVLSKVLYTDKPYGKYYVSYRDFKSRADMERNDAAYFAQFDTYKSKNYADTEAKEMFATVSGQANLSLVELFSETQDVEIFSLVYPNQSGGAEVVAPGRAIIIKLPGKNAGGIVISNLFLKNHVQRVSATELTKIEALRNGGKERFISYRGLAGKYYYYGTDTQHQEAFSLLTGSSYEEIRAQLKKHNDNNTMGQLFHFSNRYPGKEVKTFKDVKGISVRDAIIKGLMIENNAAAQYLRSAMYESTGLEKVGDRLIPFFETIRMSLHDKEYEINTEQFIVDMLSVISIAYPALGGLKSMMLEAKLTHIIHSGLKGPSLFKALGKEMASLGVKAGRIFGGAIYDLIEPFPVNSYLSRDVILKPEEGIPAAKTSEYTPDTPDKAVSGSSAFRSEWKVTDSTLDSLQPDEFGVYKLRPEGSQTMQDFKYYIKQNGEFYQVRFDADNNTLRVVDPKNTNRSGPSVPVRLNENNEWEVHTDVGLKGGGLHDIYSLFQKKTSVSVGGIEVPKYELDEKYKKPLNEMSESYRASADEIAGGAKSRAIDEYQKGQATSDEPEYVEYDKLTLNEKVEKYLHNDTSHRLRGALSKKINADLKMAEDYAVAKSVKKWEKEAISNGGKNIELAPQSLILKAQTRKSLPLAITMSRALEGQVHQKYLANLKKLRDSANIMDEEIFKALSDLQNSGVLNKFYVKKNTQDIANDSATNSRAAKDTDVTPDLDKTANIALVNDVIVYSVGKAIDEKMFFPEGSGTRSVILDIPVTKEGGIDEWHTASITKGISANNEINYTFYDPSFGMVSFSNFDKLNSFVDKTLSSVYAVGKVRVKKLNFIGNAPDLKNNKPGRNYIIDNIINNYWGYDSFGKTNSDLSMSGHKRDSGYSSQENILQKTPDSIKGFTPFAQKPLEEMGTLQRPVAHAQSVGFSKVQGINHSSPPKESIEKIVDYTKNQTLFNNYTKQGVKINEFPIAKDAMDLFEAVRSLPNATEVVYRGMSSAPDVYGKKIKKGDFVLNNSFMSTSLSKNYANSFASQGKNGVLFEIYGRSHKNISEYSRFQGGKGEAEYLFNPGAIFEVKDIRTENGLHLVTLSEVVNNDISIAKNIYTGEEMKIVRQPLVRTDSTTALFTDEKIPLTEAREIFGNKGNFGKKEIKINKKIWYDYPTGDHAEIISRDEINPASKKGAVTSNQSPETATSETGNAMRKTLSLPALPDYDFLPYTNVYEYFSGKIAKEPKFENALTSPAGRCHEIMPIVAQFMSKNDFKNIRLRGMNIWSNATHRMPQDHFVVVGERAGKDYVFDLTAHQFKGKDKISGPLIMLDEEWKQVYKESFSRSLIYYNDYPYSQLKTGQTIVDKKRGGERLTEKRKTTGGVSSKSTQPVSESSKPSVSDYQSSNVVSANALSGYQRVNSWQPVIELNTPKWFEDLRSGKVKLPEDEKTRGKRDVENTIVQENEIEDENQNQPYSLVENADRDVPGNNRKTSLPSSIALIVDGKEVWVSKEMLLELIEQSAENSKP